MPLFPLAMVGGLVVQQQSIGSLAMDVLITAAMASLNLNLLAEAWQPLLVLAPQLFADAWVERAIADLGQGTGVTAIGLLLLLMADP